MVTEQDLNAARAEFDAAFKKARLTGEAPVLGQLRSMALDGLDEFPISDQIEQLRDATVRFRDYADKKDDLDDLPNLYISGASKS